MTSTTPLTCAALYEYDLTFRAGIAKWVADRRCPVALADFLREQGLDAAADCADWCATEPERPTYNTRAKSGPFPSFDDAVSDDGHKQSYPAHWYWMLSGSNWLETSDDVPLPQNFSVSFYDLPTPADAILYLLDNWKPRT